MTTARNHRYFLNEPTYFHLMNRCVRRAFLCGKDKLTGKSYKHRKRWLHERLLKVMKRLFILVVFCLLSGCEKYYYYFTVENEQQVTRLELYKRDFLKVYFIVYNGHISTLNIFTSKNHHSLDVEILRYEHSLLSNEIIYIPSLMGDSELGVIKFSEAGWAGVTTQLALDPMPESMVESVMIEMLIDGEPVIISKKWDITRASYSRLEALWNI